MARKKLLHLKSNVVNSNGTPKLPTSEQIELGEIAVNYANGHETLAIKNSNGDVVSFSNDKILMDYVDTRLDKVEDEYISGITVNGSGVTVSDNVASLTLTSAPSTGAAETPIIVETSNNGDITLKLEGLDCGYYA